jgi:hypothetical protein
VTGRWLAFHFYYHGDRDLLVRKLLHPLVTDLLGAGRIEAFHFVRHAIGGPHVRLRLRVPDLAAGTVPEVEHTVRQAAHRFFRRSPSTCSEPVPLVRETTRRLVAGDPAESDLEVYPDNSCMSVPPAFEFDRYGGPRAIEDSWDYFTLSSVHAMRASLDPASPRLSVAVRSLVWQAWAFARRDAELRWLVEYPRRYWTNSWVAAAADAERLVGARSDHLAALLAGEVSAIARRDPGLGPTTLVALADGARSLSESLERAAPLQRLAVCASQMHMTANRLGVTNTAEVYLSRIVARALDGSPAPSPAPLGHRDLATVRTDACAALVRAWAPDMEVAQ